MDLFLRFLGLHGTPLMLPGCADNNCCGNSVVVNILQTLLKLAEIECSCCTDHSMNRNAKYCTPLGAQCDITHTQNRIIKLYST